VSINPLSLASICCSKLTIVFLSCSFCGLATGRAPNRVGKEPIRNDDWRRCSWFPGGKKERTDILYGQCKYISSSLTALVCICLCYSDLSVLPGPLLSRCVNVAMSHPRAGNGFRLDAHWMAVKHRKYKVACRQAGVRRNGLMVV
jgi:hypothetical protein